jgi:very-short-patch-repair endonuclease
MPRIAPDKTARARALRNAATAEERILWARLRHAHPRFTRQLPVGRYILDFACRSAKLGVELDGSQHLDTSSYDVQRARFLEDLGWFVLRFWNSEIRHNPDGVAEVIVASVASRLGPTHPRPLPFREGR